MDQPSWEWLGEPLEIFHFKALTETYRVAVQPRAGCNVCTISSHVRL